VIPPTIDPPRSARSRTADPEPRCPLPATTAERQHRLGGAPSSRPAAAGAGATAALKALWRLVARGKWVVLAVVVVWVALLDAPRSTLMAADSLLTMLAICVAAGLVFGARRQRRRVVEAERQRFARDLHDGAQQRLVHTVITLKLARRTLRTGEYADVLVAEALANAEEAMRELRDLAHGELTVARGGLRAGVEALAERLSVPVEVDVAVGRLPRSVETNAYFIVAEALTNVVKYARATGALVSARIVDGALCLQVRDDGVGGARIDGGSGLLGLQERAESLGGRLEIDSPPGGGTWIIARLPLPDTVSWSLPAAPLDSRAA
jgi:signal transduction histidine kinase